MTLSLAAWAVGTAIYLHFLHTAGAWRRSNYIVGALLFEYALLPYVIGGILLVRGDTRALYWIATAVIFSFAKIILDASVLLVEIDR